MANGNAWAVPRTRSSETAKVNNKAANKKGFGNIHTVSRAPSPPIRYELKPDIKRDQRFGIRHKVTNQQQPRLPKLTQRGRILAKRTPPPVLPNSNSSTSNSTMTTSASSGFDEPSDITEEDVDKGGDDNMSLISMTNLIADDVCRLQNLSFDNIGPNIRPSQQGSNNQQQQQSKTIIDMDVNVIERKQTPPKAPKTFSKKFTVWDNHPRSAPESRNMKSMEVEVVDDIDNISEITPTGCAKFGSKPRNRRRSSSRPTKGTTQSPKDDSLIGLIESVAAQCLPQDMGDMNNSVSDAQTKFNVHNNRSKGVTSGQQNGEARNGPECCGDVDYSDRPSHTRSYSYNFVKNNNNNNNSNNMLGTSHCSPSQTTVSAPTSVPTNPVFKSNADRYNQLVIGLMEHEEGPSATEMPSRKFSPGWFKSKRELNKRRNITQVVAHQQQVAAAAATVGRKKEQASADQGHGKGNVEVVWKQSDSFKEQKKMLSSRGSDEALPNPETHGRTPIFKKLLKRGKSRERKRQLEHEQEERQAKANTRAVEITATDTPSWKPPQENKPRESNSWNEEDTRKAMQCVSSSIESNADLAVNVCNADVTMAIVGAAVAAAADDSHPEKYYLRPVSPRSGLAATAATTTTTRNKDSPRDSFVTRTTITPSRKGGDPVWRGVQDSDFQPRWPKVESSRDSPPTVSVSPPRKNHAPTRKNRMNRMRCYHRNSDPVELKDDDSFPTMKWTDSSGSYEEDDNGQEDLKVLSIIGHHVSSSELERHAAVAGFNGGVRTSSPFVPRHPQGKISDKSKSSPSYSSTSSSSGFSSSSSSASRPKVKGLSKTDMEDLQCLSENDKDAEFAVALSSSAAHMVSSDEDNSSGDNRHPWRKDIHPVTPPKIQRSSRDYACFNAKASRSRSTGSGKKRSPPRMGVPRHPRMMV